MTSPNLARLRVVAVSLELITQWPCNGLWIQYSRWLRRFERGWVSNSISANIDYLVQIVKYGATNTTDTKKRDIILLNMCLTHLHLKKKQLLMVKLLKMGDLPFGQHSSVKSKQTKIGIGNRNNIIKLRFFKTKNSVAMYWN